MAEEAAELAGWRGLLVGAGKEKRDEVKEVLIAGGERRGEKVEARAGWSGGFGYNRWWRL